MIHLKRPYFQRTAVQAFALFSCLLILFGQAGMSAFNPQEITEYEKRLEKIAAEIENLKSNIRREEKRKSSLLSQLDQIAFKKKLAREELTMYSMQQRRANQELSALEQKIPKLESELAEAEGTIRKILVTMYKFGRLRYFDFLLRIDRVENLITENNHLSQLARNQEKIISDYRKTLGDLTEARRGLESKKAQISDLLLKSREKQTELNTQEKRHLALVREINQNESSHLQALGELKERAEQLQALMKKILSKQVAFPTTIIPMYENKGKLIWPIAGTVVTSFGIKRHPRFNTRTRSNGIEITPKKSMVVKSVHAGSIVYADYFQGYGNLIIVDHGVAYHSLYGHCSDFLVKKGDFVNAQQPIATVGDISSFSGKTLYFEIRYKTKPLNPLQWLKRR